MLFVKQAVRNLKLAIRCASNRDTVEANDPSQVF
jgi:hypothetical protein